jgi:transcription initiation factor TFIIB
LTIVESRGLKGEQLRGSVCPECGGGILVTDPATGEVSCPSCGYVVVERGLDSRPDWTVDEEGVEKKRAGPPLSIMFHDYGLSTAIDQVDVDATGRRLPEEVREDMLKLKKLDSTSMVDLVEARNLQHAACILQIYVDKLSLGRQVAETAMCIYRRALKKGLVKGRSIRSIVAGSLYAACRLMSVPRSLEEFERAYPMVRRRTIAQVYRLLVRNLGLKAPIQDPSIFVTKIASKLGLSQKTVREAFRILDEARGKGLLIGKDPVGVAAAALYIACKGCEARQKDLAKAAGVTEATIRHRCDELMDALS